MPTTLPARSTLNIKDDGLAGYAMALLRVYGAIAGLVVLLAVAEHSFGMFEGLTLAESVLKATGTDLPGQDDATVYAAAGWNTTKSR